jgi:ketosteroid isomerase-like protein
MTVHDNASLLESFYKSFQQKDGDGMADCYHADIRFSDPVFVNLEGEQAGGMWRMLCARAADLEVEFSGIEADDEQGKAHWEARYTFSKTGRKVHNRIDARFRFRDGKIIEHLDHFDFWRWSRMALGPIGLLLGWSPIVRNKVRRQSAALLKSYLERQGTQQ